jgi:hypothetical protein
LVALVGGTVAWFYLNEEVTIGYGNSIFCEAGDSLEIALVKNGTPSRWSSMIDHSAGDFSVVDITGDGYHLYRPSEIDEVQQPVGFVPAISSLDDESSFDYIEMEVAFRSLSKMNVYLSDESYIQPVNPDDDGSNIYGDFSRDYIAGAMRVAIIDGSDVRMLWAPNSQYELVRHGDGTFSFRTGLNGNSTRENSYSYYVRDPEGSFSEQQVTADEYAAKKFIVDSTGASKAYSGNSASLISLNPASEGEYDQKTVKIRIWFEGTDREAHQALAGGNVNVKLKFVGINKEEAEETKQRDIENITFNDATGEFDGLRDGMVFSTDGLKWNTYHSGNSNLPALESGSSIYIKYPESDTHFETVYRKFTKA